MKITHKQLANGGWQKLSLMEQLANIGSEVERAIKWKKKQNKDYSQLAFFRCLELLDFSLSDPKNRSHLSEIVRLREVLVDYFYGKNIYGSTEKNWHSYFYGFNLVARVRSSPSTFHHK